MTFKNISHFIIVIIIYFFWANFVSASVIINEVQISPTEERFIELYNNGSSDVDLTDWYIQRKTATGSSFGSLVSKTSFSGKSIGAGEYFLISKGSTSGADITLDNFTITESNTIQLKNSGQEVVSKVGWGDASDCDESCASNPPIGKSIQRVSSDWVVASPTPGSSNSSTAEDDEEDNDEDNGSSNSDSDDNIDKNKLLPLKISTKIIAPKIVVAGTPFVFSSLTTTNRKEVYKVGKFLWNFGDGMTTSTKESGPFEYVYEYPGEYVLTLSYFDNSFVQIPDATDRIVVKVVDSGIIISGVGNYSDPYIKIENKSNYEIDLSGWIITTTQGKTFAIPDGMNILSNKKIKLSPKITGFTNEDLSHIFISNPSGETVAVYPTFKRGVSKIKASQSVPSSNLDVKNENPKESQLLDSNVINLDNLGANAGSQMTKIPNSVYPIAGMFLVIGAGVASFISIKKNDKKDNEIESKISADDIKIIE